MSSTNRGAVRNAADYYATPKSAFKPILPFLKEAPGPIWEPAAGDGRLVRWMRDAGLDAAGDDLSNGYDYLKDTSYRGGTVITNPPFSLAFEFCKHATNISGDEDEAWMLLRLNFLGSAKRAEWWRDHEPSALFVLSPRPSFTEGGTDSCEYAWFYWGERWNGIKHPYP